MEDESRSELLLIICCNCIGIGGLRLINPRLLRMRSEGYCSRFVCVCVCLQRFKRNEVPTQYKSKKKKNINGGFFLKMLHSREMAMSVYIQLLSSGHL